MGLYILKRRRRSPVQCQRRGWSEPPEGKGIIRVRVQGFLQRMPTMLSTNTSHLSSTSDLLLDQPAVATVMSCASSPVPRRPCVACRCSALPSCRSRQRVTPTQQTGCRACRRTSLATQATKASAQTSPLRLRAAGHAKETGRSGWVICYKAGAPRLDPF
ncbi:hypothetical protein EDB87DRAFT_1658520 [Lactarius vividus]|nr:hypothetical protein EDB87DRAFT_1658520 [Lactarius vividus]